MSQGHNTAPLTCILWNLTPRPCDQDFSTLPTELTVLPNHMNNEHDEIWGRGYEILVTMKLRLPFACKTVRSLPLSYNTQSLTNCILWKYGIASVNIAVVGIDTTLLSTSNLKKDATNVYFFSFFSFFFWVKTRWIKLFKFPIFTCRLSVYPVCLSVYLSDWLAVCPSQWKPKRYNVITQTIRHLLF